MYKDRIRIISSISDIHLGASTITAEEFKYQLYERYIKPMDQLSILDIIAINGDVAHLSLSFNSKMAEVYLWFFDSVVNIAKKKNASIIVVKGTLSHDYDQLDNVKFYKSEVEMYFAEEPMVVETKGLKIYCLPDVFVKEKKDENKLYKYANNTFDIILGHGHVTETQFIKQESEHSISKNIIYDTNQLLRMCKGPIFFGHIHTYMNIKKRLYYISSFTRFIHGEEADKGWILTAYIPETGRFKAERVINDLAFNFNTYTIGHNRFDKMDADDIIKKVDKFIEEYSVDRLCLEISYINTDANIAKIHILRNYYSRNKIVNKTKFKSLSEKEAQFVEASEKETEKRHKKSYLVDKSLTIEEKLQRFIKEEYKVDLPLEKIQNVLLRDDLLGREEGD